MNIPKTCWYCHKKNTLKPDNHGAFCTECWATWSPPVHYGPPCLEVQCDATGAVGGSPSAGAIAQQNKLIMGVK